MLVTSWLLCFTLIIIRACSSAVEQGTHNPLVPGSNPGGPNFRDQRTDLKIPFQRVVRGTCVVIEIAILSALVLGIRCANYQDVFVAGNVYFTDADCYARMTRVRMCQQHPGLIVRHHNFENYPRGTTPHTTAPLDYLILTLSILLVTIAICAEWTWQGGSSRNLNAIRDARMAWSALSGVAWGLAIWVSLYEPLVLFLIVLATRGLQDQHLLFAKDRRIGWILFAAIITFAFVVERRGPQLSIFHSGELFRNWSRSIGELARVWPANSIWFHWAGYMIAVAPLLIWVLARERNNGAPGGRAQAIFILALPLLLEPIKSRTAVWIAFALSIFPILGDWDERLWPNETEYGRRVEQRNESVQLRDLAINLKSSEAHPF